MISITIPTIKPEKELLQQINDIRHSLSDYREGNDYEIVIQSYKQSAAKNRNAVLEKSNGEYVIMIDDDIRGYFKGWAHEMITPLINDNNIKILSARLMTINNTPATMISYSRFINECKKDIWFNPYNLLPSACITFSRDTWQQVKNNSKLPDNIPFDENYILANAEDSDFCMAVKKTFPNAKIGVNKKVEIKHVCEEKWRTKNPEDWMRNHRLFEKKWGCPCH